MSKNAAFYELLTGTVTHDPGGSINLIIASTSLTNSIVEGYVKHELDYTSDNRTICTTIEYGGNCRSQKPGRRFRLDQIKEKEFVLCLERQKDLVESKLAKASQESFLRNEKAEALDKIAEQLGATFFQALKWSIPRTKNSSKGEPWWDDKCQLAARKFKQKNKYCDLDRAANIEDAQAWETRAEARFQLRQTVKLAKRHYYYKLIQGLDHHTIFRAIGWAMSQRQYTTSTIIRSDGSLATSNIAKQQALRETLLTPTEGIGQDTSAIDLSQVERNDIPETYMCTKEEVEYAISQMGNSSARKDKIPPRVIKKAWPILKKHITSFFDMCLHNRHYL